MQAVIVTATSAGYRERALRCLGQLPPFSPTLSKLMASLAREDASFAGISDVIEKDAVVSGNVLKLVNSALYARRGTVNSVRHAVALLGLDKLRNAALSMSVSRMWKQLPVAEGWSMARFNLHSVATGILADLIAQRLPVQYPEGAFVAGLLHDLGSLLIAIGMPQEYVQIVKLSLESNRGLEICEQDVIGVTHCELSADALAEWNLPEQIQTAVRHHHDPARDETPLRDCARLRLSAILQAADAYVDSLGHSILPSGPQPPHETPQEGLLRLGMENELPSILEMFAAEFGAIRQFF